MRTRLLLTALIGTVLIGQASAQLVVGVSAAGTSALTGGVYVDLAAGTAKQLWTGSVNTGRVTGLASDGTNLYTAASARFGRWSYGSVGSAPTLINNFYRLGSNNIVYGTGAAGMTMASNNGSPLQPYLYTNYNATGSGPYVEDGIYVADTSVTTLNTPNLRLVWRHDDLAYNFEGLAFNPNDGLFYATNNPSASTTSTAGLYTIDAFGTGAVTRIAGYNSYISAPDGLAFGDGKLWMTQKPNGSTELRVLPYDLATGQYLESDAFALPGFGSGGMYSTVTWAPGAAVPEPATIAALGLGAVALIRRRRRA